MVISKRIVWIDWAKAILIYLMVVGHCFPVKWQSDMIYAFHMPAFFVISGYLYHPHSWQRTVKSFGIPVLFFSFVHLVVYILWNIWKGSLDLSNFIVRFFGPFFVADSPGIDYVYLCRGVWFIITLFCCRLFFGDIKAFSFVRKHAVLVLILLLIWLTIEPFILKDNPLLYFKCYRMIPSMPFVIVGYLMKDSFHVERINRKTFFLLFAFFVTVSELQGRCNILNYVFGISYLLFFVNAVIGSVCLFYICNHFKENKMIICFSVGTFLILAFNMDLKIFLELLLNKINLGFLKDYDWLFAWIESFVIMAICYYPIKWLMRKCPILLGKVS